MKVSLVKQRGSVRILNRTDQPNETLCCSAMLATPVGRGAKAAGRVLPSSSDTLAEELREQE